MWLKNRGNSKTNTFLTESSPSFAVLAINDLCLLFWTENKVCHEKPKQTATPHCTGEQLYVIGFSWLAILVCHFYQLHDERKGRKSVHVKWRREREREYSDPSGICRSIVKNCSVCWLLEEGQNYLCLCIVYTQFLPQVSSIIYKIIYHNTLIK